MDYSIVVPAYNEQSRISEFLKDLIKFNKTGRGEIVVVNDGSTDRTLDVLKGFERNINIVSYKRNMGKGYAVKQGMLSSRGKKIIFMDADGATPASEIPNMLKALEKHDIVIGTRILKESRILKSQPFYRVFLGKVFNKLVNIMFSLDITDNLCGFKGFEGNIGRKLAKEMISHSWEFDVEILVRAKKHGYNIFQIPIKWQDVDNSKLSSFKDPVIIFINMFFLMFRL